VLSALGHSRRLGLVGDMSALPWWPQSVDATLYLERARWSVWLCVKDIVEVLLRHRRRSYGIAGSEGSL
jgi:hypothetical protein